MKLVIFVLMSFMFLNLALAQDVKVMGADGQPVVIQQAVSDPVPVDNSLIGLVVAIVFAINALLFGLYNALGYIKDKTSTQLDNKLYAFLAMVLGWLQKLIEVVGPVTAVKAVTKDKPT